MKKQQQEINKQTTQNKSKIEGRKQWQTRHLRTVAGLASVLPQHLIYFHVMLATHFVSDSAGRQSQCIHFSGAAVLKDYTPENSEHNNKKKKKNQRHTCQDNSKHGQYSGQKSRSEEKVHHPMMLLMNLTSLREVYSR